MKRLCLLLIMLSLLTQLSCRKEKHPDYIGDYTVEGYLYASKNMKPLAGKLLCLSQQNQTYSLNHPEGRTDSTGYFKITYTSEKTKVLFLYPAVSKPDCVNADIALLKAIPKGRNVNVGKIYTFSFNHNEPKNETSDNHLSSVTR